mmetsp:Transcript_30387/g.46532  ORF Transcript_30387/g.46532 Transcript_30387/m.46532 type:complete len:307 (-) Transcript_30387:73-993(-)
MCNDQYSDEDSCDANNACSWCACSAVPSACHSLDTASALPAPTFICDKAAKLKHEKKVYKDDDEMCNSDYSDHDSCVDNSKCTWCECAAVPSSCHDWATAESLPQSVFDCEGVSKSRSLLMSLTAEPTCGDISSEDSCNKSDCSWCVSAAVPSACYDPEVAKTLPSSVFSCSDLEEEEASEEFNAEYMGVKYHSGSKKHHGHHDKKGCHGHCMAGPIFLAVLTIAQLYFIKSMKNALEDLDEANGIPKPQSCCSWKKKWECCATQQQPRSAQAQPAAPINESFDYSMEEPVIAQAPSTQRVQNSMA